MALNAAECSFRFFAIELPFLDLGRTQRFYLNEWSSFWGPAQDEQQRITEIFLATDEIVQQYSSVLCATSTLIDALVAQFLDNEWPATQCEDVLIDGPRNGFSPKCNAEKRGFPTLGLGAVRNGQIIAEGNLKYAEISEVNLERFRLHRDDVLVVRGNGNKDLCGRCGIVEDVPQNCFYPDLLIRLQFDPHKMIPAFAALQWNTRATHSRLLQRAKSTNGIWKVNGKDIKQHVLVAPPIEEQKCFLRQLETPFAAMSAITDAVTKSVQLKERLVNTLLKRAQNVQ